ncbi:hypothetical protein PIIN_08030 [Serendipita indica DSM 11827]|uniref:SH3 domain-containing protein n=1 Tax=Serendipita indica (strain DSM 11827) TaxID=1109443 RepID=G4TRY3_SERID|nr:hypothetical protein PIIN_08030 [Serendipita indica DSM 11827]
MPSSASPYPSPSSAFYPPPIPASHEFANKLANNKRYRGAAGNVNLITGGVGGLSGSANGQPSASGTEAYLSATSATSGRRASDAFLGQSTSPVTAPGSVSAPNSRRTSRDAAKNQEPSSSLAKPSIKPTSEEVEETSAPENPPIQEQVGLSNPVSQTQKHLNVDPLDDLLSPSPKSTASDSTLTPSTKRFSLTSLTSSRPAPPSPGPSRRPSLQRKNSSKRRSVHSNGSRDTPIMPLSTTPTEKSMLGSGVTPGDYASRRQSSLSMSFTAFAAEGGTEEQEEPTTPAPPTTSANLEDDVEEYVSIIIVRDFAYAEDDERFSKRPIESLPMSERPAVEAGQAHDREDGWDDDGDDWDHRWHYADDDGSGSMTPLRDGSHAYDEDSQAHGKEYGYAQEEIDPDMPLPPGIYRAVYAFEAEGTAEMSLQEGDLVKVIGRGGGVGWAVVERGWKAPPGGVNGTFGAGDDGKSGGLEDGSGSGALALAGQALVPESYLEPYQLE